jgi:hypothetical protein
MPPLLMPIYSHGVRPGSDGKFGGMNHINGCAAWWSYFGVPGKAHVVTTRYEVMTEFRHTPPHWRYTMMPYAFDGVEFGGLSGPFDCAVGR